MVRLKQERLRRGWNLQALGFYAGHAGRGNFAKLNEGS